MQYYLWFLSFSQQYCIKLVAYEKDSIELNSFESVLISVIYLLSTLLYLFTKMYIHLYEHK